MEELDFDPFYQAKENPGGLQLESVRVQSVEQYELFFDQKMTFNIRYDALITAMEYMKENSSISFTWPPILSHHILILSHYPYITISLSMQATFEQALKYIKELPPTRTPPAMQPRPATQRSPTKTSLNSTDSSSRPLRARTRPRHPVDSKLWRSTNGTHGRSTGRWANKMRWRNMWRDSTRSIPSGTSRPNSDHNASINNSKLWGPLNMKGKRNIVNVKNGWYADKQGFPIVYVV